jgi:hypothetical protein
MLLVMLPGFWLHYAFGKLEVLLLLKVQLAFSQMNA